MSLFPALSGGIFFARKSPHQNSIPFKRNITHSDSLNFWLCICSGVIRLIRLAWNKAIKTGIAPACVYRMGINLSITLFHLSSHIISARSRSSCVGLKSGVLYLLPAIFLAWLRRSACGIIQYLIFSRVAISRPSSTSVFRACHSCL